MKDKSSKTPLPDSPTELDTATLNQAVPGTGYLMIRRRGGLLALLRDILIGSKHFPSRREYLQLLRAGCTMPEPHRSIRLL